MKLSKDMNNSTLMKIKTLFVLPGTIMLMLAILPVIPYFNNAADAQPAQAQRWGKQLNLTDAQKEQIKQIHESAKEQIDAILTQDQKDQLQQARQQHTRPSLNLSDEQKAQIKKIRQDAQSQIEALLTPEQQQQLQQWHQQRWQRHHQQQ
jgi:Spy/CpxP family protein refolding chaperone